MKSDSWCFISLMEEAYAVVIETVDDENKRFEIMRGVASVLSEISIDDPDIKNKSLVMSSE